MEGFKFRDRLAREMGKLLEKWKQGWEKAQRDALAQERLVRPEGLCSPGPLAPEGMDMRRTVAWLRGAGPALRAARMGLEGFVLGCRNALRVQRWLLRLLAFAVKQAGQDEDGEEEQREVSGAFLASGLFWAAAPGVPLLWFSENVRFRGKLGRLAGAGAEIVFAAYLLAASCAAFVAAPLLFPFSCALMRILYAQGSAARARAAAAEPGGLGLCALWCHSALGPSEAAQGTFGFAPLSSGAALESRLVLFGGSRNALRLLAGAHELYRARRSGTRGEGPAAALAQEWAKTACAAGCACAHAWFWEDLRRSGQGMCLGELFWARRGAREKDGGSAEELDRLALEDCSRLAERAAESGALGQAAWRVFEAAGQKGWGLGRIAALAELLDRLCAPAAGKGPGDAALQAFRSWEEMKALQSGAQIGPGMSRRRQGSARAL